MGGLWLNGYNVFDTVLSFGGDKPLSRRWDMGREALEPETNTNRVTLPL